MQRETDRLIDVAPVVRRRIVGAGPLLSGADRVRRTRSVSAAQARREADGDCNRAAMRLLVDGAQGRKRTSDTYRVGQPLSREAGELGLASHVGTPPHRDSSLGWPYRFPESGSWGTNDVASASGF